MFPAQGSPSRAQNDSAACPPLGGAFCSQSRRDPVCVGRGGQNRSHSCVPRDLCAKGGFVCSQLREHLSLRPECVPGGAGGLDLEPLGICQATSLPRDGGLKLGSSQKPSRPGQERKGGKERGEGRRQAGPGGGGCRAGRDPALLTYSANARVP